MEIWQAWLAILAQGLGYLTLQVGLSEAIAIILLTLLARICLMPISFKSAYKMVKNRHLMDSIKPEIEDIKLKYASDPSEVARRTMALYKERGITFLDKLSLLNIGTQGFFSISMFQSLAEMLFNSRFLWIANIARSDALLCVLVGFLTFLSMWMMPGAGDQNMLIIYLVPALVMTFVLAGLPSAIGIYWATSNLVTLAQSYALNRVIAYENSVSG